jgi:hypothetical protein
MLFSVVVTVYCWELQETHIRRVENVDCIVFSLALNAQLLLKEMSLGGLPIGIASYSGIF